jgi:hypothetical protein
VTTVQNLAVGSQYVYWTDASSMVARVPIAGGAVQTIAQGQSKPWGLDVDGAYVYWSNQLGGAIMRALDDGSGTPQVVASASQPGDLAVHAGNVYWIDQGSNVWVAPETGGTASVAASPGTGAGRLIGSPRGPIVSYTASSFSLVSILDGWTQSFGEPATTADIAQDGVNVYYAPHGGYAIGALDLATGRPSGRYDPLLQTYCNPAAAFGCGVLCYGALARLGVNYLAPFLPGSVDRAAVSSNYAFFHSTTDNAIGKVAIP